MGRFKIGFKDKSGLECITVMDKSSCVGRKPILKTHWGCSCCDRETTDEDVKFAKIVAQALNEYEQKHGKIKL